MEPGANMRGFSGFDFQVSGIAGRLSLGLMTASCFPPFSASSADLLAARRRSRFWWAIWRGAGILLPFHIQAYFSARFWFCLSRSL